MLLHVQYSANKTNIVFTLDPVGNEEQMETGEKTSQSVPRFTEILKF